MRQNARRILGGNRTVPTSATGASKDIGTEAAIQAVMELGGEGVVRGLRGGASAVYRGYLKPSLAKSSLAKADTIVKTALDEGLPMTRWGGEKAQGVIKALRTEVANILAMTPGTVDLKLVADRVRAFARQKYYRPGVDLTDYQTALAVADKIDQHPALGLPPGARATRVEVPLSAADEIKRGLDTSVGDSQFGVTSKTKTTTEKFARRVIRQDIEAKAPGVAPLNARESKLIDTARALARAVGRESNKSPLIGVNTLASGAFGAEEYRRTGDPYSAAAAALAIRMALTPAATSRVAIIASRLGRMPGAVPANVARVAVQAVLETGDVTPQSTPGVISHGGTERWLR
jgi:hypothetical protein